MAAFRSGRHPIAGEGYLLNCIKLGDYEKGLKFIHNVDGKIQGFGGCYDRARLVCELGKGSEHATEVFRKIVRRAISKEGELMERKLDAALIGTIVSALGEQENPLIAQRDLSVAERSLEDHDDRQVSSEFKRARHESSEKLKKIKTFIAESANDSPSSLAVDLEQQVKKLEELDDEFRSNSKAFQQEKLDSNKANVEWKQTILKDQQMIATMDREWHLPKPANPGPPVQAPDYNQIKVPLTKKKIDYETREVKERVPDRDGKGFHTETKRERVKVEKEVDRSPAEIKADKDRIFTEWTTKYERYVRISKEWNDRKDLLTQKIVEAKDKVAANEMDLAESEKRIKEMQATLMKQRERVTLQRMALAAQNQSTSAIDMGFLDAISYAHEKGILLRRLK